MRKLFIAANWKMNHNKETAKDFIEKFPTQLEGVGIDQLDIAIAVPFVYLKELSERLEEANNRYHLNLRSGAQNMHWEASGAFTGEISAQMLVDIGCTYVILGHSERRAMFGETNENISKKALVAFSNGLLPIICVGETLEQRENNETTQVVKAQLQGSLAGLSTSQIEATTLAYEPVWAIGTGKAATPAMAQEVHKMIRDFLTENYGEAVSRNVRIQYGGSVKAGNAAELMSQEDIDGALVGGASLKPDSFAELIKNAIS